MDTSRTIALGMLWSVAGGGLAGIAASLAAPTTPLWAATAAGSLAASLAGWFIVVRRG